MYSMEETNPDIMIEILPVRQSSNFMSTPTKSLYSEITDTENTYYKYDKYFNDCIEYSDNITLAKNMVDTIKEESEELFGSHSSTSTSKEKEEFTSCYTEFISNINKEKPEFIWPTIKEFTVEEGAVKIDEYLSSFYTEENWMYVMYYRGVQESSSVVAHTYQVMFSLPTWKYPVAQATASLYFVIEVSKLKPPTCAVNVLYWYETFRQMHSPDSLNFDEKWLTYILDEKMKLFRQIRY